MNRGGKWGDGTEGMRGGQEWDRREWGPKMRREEEKNTQSRQEDGNETWRGWSEGGTGQRK